MKKLLLTIAAVCVFTFANAQRKADISVRMNTPAGGATIRTGVNFSVNITVKNNGPDNVLTSDTLVYYLGVGNQYFPATQELLPIAFDMLPGDSFSYNLTKGLSGGNGAQMDVCSYVVLFNRALPDSVFDVNMLTNRDCKTVTYSGVGIGEITAGLNFSSTIYPNPASGNAFVEFNSPSNEAAVVNVYNSNGQLVGTFKNVSDVDGTQLVELNLEGLANGLYFYTISAGKNTSTGKFIIN